MKTKFGAIITDGRGKIGGQVASRNRSGSYLRNKVTPSNPRTGAQMTARNLLAGLSQAWRTLTEAQREAWNAAVEDYKKTDIFGDLVTPTGKNLYVGLNANLSKVGESNISVPAVPTEVRGPEFDFNPSIAASLAISVQVAGVGDKYYLQATPSVSPGKTYLDSLYRTIASGAVADFDGLTPLTAYTDKFGAPVVGQKVGFRVSYVSGTTGQRSTYPVKARIILQ